MDGSLALEVEEDAEWGAGETAEGREREEGCWALLQEKEYRYAAAVCGTCNS